MQDLAAAAPSTVSRCGMVYVPSETTGWRPYIRTWLAHLNDALRKQSDSGFKEISPDIYKLFDDHVDNGIRYIRKNCKEYIASVDINLVTTTLLHPRLGVAPQER